MKRFWVNKEAGNCIEVDISNYYRNGRNHNIQLLIELLKQIQAHINIKYLRWNATHGPDDFFSMIYYDDYPRIAHIIYSFLEKHAVEKILPKQRVGNENHVSYIYSQYIIEVRDFFNLIGIFVKDRTPRGNKPSYNWVITHVTFSLLDENKEDKIAFSLFDGGNFLLHNRFRESGVQKIIDSKFIDKLLPILREWEKEIDELEKKENAK